MSVASFETSCAPATSTLVFSAGTGRNLENVAPDMVDRLEFEGAGLALRIAFFDVEAGRQPQVGLDVGAP